MTSVLLNTTKPLNIVAVSGGLNHPSKTEALVQAIIDELGEATPIKVHFIQFSEIGTLLGGAIYRHQLPQRVQDDLAAVEAADALIVGTPVYRASFTGLFKHFLILLNKQLWLMCLCCWLHRVVVTDTLWFLNINYVHCSAFSKRKRFRLVYMRRIGILRLNTPFKANCCVIELPWRLLVHCQFWNGRLQKVVGQR